MIAVPCRPLVIAATLIGLFVSGCSRAPTGYPLKGDSKPHPGVAAARDYAVHGIDISKYQGEIDWHSVKLAGTRFVFIKATEGGDHLDERFHTNWAAAKAAGIPRGAYHFTYWCRPANEQMAWFRKHVPADADALPPVLDLEWNGHSKTCRGKPSREQALAMIREMLDAMEEHTGKKPIIYTDVAFHRDILVGQFDDHHYWLRSVAAHPSEKFERPRWTFWQYTATGTVPGIRGPVDRNAFIGTDAQLKAMTDPPK